MATKSKKNPAAVALGWLGGLKGGLVRTASMTPAQRSAGDGSYRARFEHVDN